MQQLVAAKDVKPFLAWIVVSTSAFWILDLLYSGRLGIVILPLSLFLQSMVFEGLNPTSATLYPLASRRNVLVDAIARLWLNVTRRPFLFTRFAVYFLMASVAVAALTLTIGSSPGGYVLLMVAGLAFYLICYRWLIATQPDKSRLTAH